MPAVLRTAAPRYVVAAATGHSCTVAAAAAVKGGECIRLESTVVAAAAARHAACVVPGTGPAAAVARSTPSTGSRGPPPPPPPPPPHPAHRRTAAVVRPLHCHPPRESSGATSSGPPYSGTTMSSGGSWGRRRGGEFPPRPWSFRYRPRFRRCHRSAAAAARLPRSFGSSACLPAISCGGTGRDAAVALPCFLPTYSIIQLWAMGTRHPLLFRFFMNARTYVYSYSTTYYVVRVRVVVRKSRLAGVRNLLYGASEKQPSYHAQSFLSCHLPSHRIKPPRKGRNLLVVPNTPNRGQTNWPNAADLLVLFLSPFIPPYRFWVGRPGLRGATCEEGRLLFREVKILCRGSSREA